MARRKPSGEGTIYRRKDGRYEGAAWVLASNGTRKRVRVYGATRAEAHTKLTEIKVNNDQGIPAAAKTWLLSDYLDYWLEEFVKPNRRPATYAQCEQITRLYLKPGIGAHPLKRLSVPVLQSYLSEQVASGHSVAQVHIMRKVLSAALTRAQREELVSRNVARLVELPSIQGREVKPWTIYEAGKFLVAAKPYRLYAAFLLLLIYGLRRGEVLGLRWEDLDYERSEIHIRQQLTRVGKQLIHGPLKTKASNRDLPMLTPIASALNEHRAEQTARGIMSDLVFTTDAGTPIEPRNFARSFERLLKRHGLREVTVHTLRHTAATILKNLRVPARDAQVILGHSRITTTLELYQHGDIASSRNALERMETALLPAIGEPEIRQVESSGSLARLVDGSGSRQVSRQIRKTSAFLLKFFSGAGTGTLTLDLVLGKNNLYGVTDRLTVVRESSKKRERQWLIGAVAVNVAVKIHRF
ncbi:tyrosine-type recombinase/integrase [Streptomyces sp. NPDC051644]|uniref:tyrosine-type recombinase/integrase n=1 Tax=Streptomyces sp. NPDC051644 TaxID=3365666 RepID=UPI0037BA38AE